MGSALSLPLAHSNDLLRELCALRQSHALSLVAAVAQSDENVISLDNFMWPHRVALIVGNEYSGLDATWLAACDYRVTIPVAPGCDSLNVAVAAGVFLHHMRANSNW
jgi:tRNA G18 (ribose-2'-O)-methylase SpoU